MGDPSIGRPVVPTVGRQVSYGVRDPVMREISPVSIVAGRSVPAPLIRTPPVAVIEENICLDIGSTINIGPRYHDDGRRSGNY
jgi:hypothetical protein